MVDISKFDSKSTTKADNKNFARYPSRKKLSFEQILANKDLSSFSTACVRGKLYQSIQSGQNSSFLSLNKAKHELTPERSHQVNDLLDSQPDIKFTLLTFHHSGENEDVSPESRVVREVSENVFSPNHSNSIIDEDNDNDNKSNNRELLMVTEMQNSTKCEKCSCFIF